MEQEITFQFLTTNGVKLHTAIAGPEAGELVILLHGFPEAWFGWEAQILSLAEVGYRVAAPDQRGYNLSDKPQGVGNYQAAVLADDIIGLADSLGADQFYLAGHDFGAMVSWDLAMRYPERIKRMVIANVPHPKVMSGYLRSNFSQLLKSWYAIFFQIPWLPEKMVRANNWGFLIRALPKRLSETVRDRYRKAWSQPGAITAMINWYRASIRNMGKSGLAPQVDLPTLIIWGQQDPHLSYEMALLSLEHCTDGRLETFEDATHWVMQDKPEEVNQLMLEFFS